MSAIRKAETPIGSSVVMAVGEGIIKAHDKTLLLGIGVTYQSPEIGLCHYSEVSDM